MNGRPPVWLFDGVCVLCSGAVHYTLRHEKHPDIRFIAIQSEEGRAIAREHGVDPDDPETFLFVEKGRALPKSDGVIALAAHLGGPARFLRIGRFLPRVARDFLYDLIARNRYRLFGRRETCLIPDPETRHRFVLPEQT